jgi:hypothetical protein
MAANFSGFNGFGARDIGMTGSEMTRRNFRHNSLGAGWRRFGVVAGLAIAVVIGSIGAGARAEDDDEGYVLPDTKLLRGFLKGLGLRKDGDAIDYRERSPLVLPPARDLPSPETENQAKNTAAWPNDPDVKRVKQRKEEEKKWVRDPEDGARPALPSELGPKGSGSRKDGGVPGKSAEEASAPSTLKELGAKNIFSGNWFAKTEEYKTFDGEPRRGSLTDPPPGYRTPSPNQPYGVGKEKWKPPVNDVAREVR